MKNYLFLIILIASGFSGCLAKSWHFSAIHIKATVSPDGSMHINESRSYEFRGGFHWADYRLSGLENQKILNFKMHDDYREYNESSAEEDGTYYTETAGSQFYCKWYYSASNQVKTFYLDYTITNAVQRYEDVAELYWKFIGEANPAWVDTVSIAIILPNTAAYGEVKAWAHGPLWGNIKFTHDHILLTVNDLQQNHFVEGRVIFPSQWVPQSTLISGRLEKKIIAEEKDFAEQANRARQQAIIDEEKRIENNERAFGVAMPMAVSVILIFLFLFWHYGRGFDVNYSQTIDANIPDDFHPALLNSIFFNNNVTGSTLSTSLFYLAQKEILKIEKDERRPKKWYDNADPVIISLDREQWQKQ